MNEIYDDLIGKIKTDGDDWHANWHWSNGQVVDVSINFEDDAPSALPIEIKRFLVNLKDRDHAIREKISAQMIDLLNEDWNPDQKISVEELASQIELDGLNMYYPNNQAEVFFKTKKSYFAGHSIAAFADRNCDVSDAYLAG